MESNTKRGGVEMKTDLGLKGCQGQPMDDAWSYENLSCYQTFKCPKDETHGAREFSADGHGTTHCCCDVCKIQWFVDSSD